MAARTRLQQETSAPVPSGRRKARKSTFAGASARSKRSKPSQPLRKSKRLQAQSHKSHQEPLPQKQERACETLSQISTPNPAISLGAGHSGKLTPQRRSSKRKSPHEAGDLNEGPRKRPTPPRIGAGNEVVSGTSAFARIQYWVRGFCWPKVSEPANTMAGASMGPPNLARAPPMSMSTTQSVSRMSSSRKSGNSRIGSSNRHFIDILERGHETVKPNMTEYEGGGEYGPTSEAQELLDNLRNIAQPRLADHRYGNDKTFRERWKRLRTKSEKRLILSLHDLACPLAEDLADQCMDDPVLKEKYDRLVDANDEQWNAHVAVFEKASMPKPDYCVGFAPFAFSSERRKTLGAVVGDGSRFSPTQAMYFPFLTCEAKYGENLGVADIQNAHSMALAVMAVVQIFRGAQCPDLIHREILGFSVSFNHEEVRLYGHYPVIDGEKTELYRTEIEFVRWHQNRFQDRWKTYCFVKNIYENWAPMHFERLCRAIDKFNPNWTPSALGSNDFGTPAALSESTERLRHFEIASTTSTIRTTQAAMLPPPSRPSPLPRSKASTRSTRSVHPDMQAGDQENSLADLGAPSIASSTEDNLNDSGKRGKKSGVSKGSQKRGKDA